MKVYDRVVFSMESLEVVEESFHEYDGDVAECMGGSKGSGVDRAYNSRMAALSEAAFNQSMMSENERKYGLHPGGFVSQMDKNIYASTTDPTTGVKTPYVNKDFLASGNSADAAKNSVAAQQAKINGTVSPSSAAAMRDRVSGAMFTGTAPQEVNQNIQTSLYKDDPNWAGGA